MTFRLNNFVAREFIKLAEVGGGGRVGGSGSVQPQVDIEAINDRIQAGDKEALKELDELGISYTLTQDSSGGYTVEYKYGDKNYTVRYYAPPSSTPSIAQKEEYSSQDSLISKYLQRYDTLYDSTNAAFKGENPVNETEEPEAADTSTPVPDEAEDVSQTSPDTTEETTPTEEKDYEFDYSTAGVDETVAAEELYNEDNVEKSDITLAMEGLGVASPVNTDVDSGAWDDLFAELEKMKPQLKEYLKQQLEANGYIYDEETADKLLNKFITEGVDALITDIRMEYAEENGRGFTALFGAREPENRLKTVEDIVNYIKDQIDLSPETPEDNTFASHINAIKKTYADSWYTSLFERSPEAEYEDPIFAMEKLTDDDYNSYIDGDHYLLETADYFLSDEEKEMKEVLEIVNGTASSYPAVYSKEEAIGYIDTYSEHLNKELRHKYFLMPESEFDITMDFLITSFKVKSIPEPDENLGIIFIQEVLQAFDKYVREEMEKAYTNYLENSN